MSKQGCDLESCASRETEQQKKEFVLKGFF